MILSQVTTRKCASPRESIASYLTTLEWKPWKSGHQYL